MRITLTGERRRQLVDAVQAHFREHHDEEVGELRATLLIDLFLRELGPVAYNQGVADAQAYLQDKLVDLESEVREPEP